MRVIHNKIKTCHGALAVTLSTGGGLPLVFLHGNSLSAQVFLHQMESPLASHYQFVLIDLPGHGGSENAPDPEAAYQLPGYAAAILDVLQALSIGEAAFYGFSLGGHIALEIAARWEGTVGVMLSGAPPASPSVAGLEAAFMPHPLLALVGKEDFSEEDCAFFAEAVFGPEPPAFIRQTIRRTDGRARRFLFESILAGKAYDEKLLIAESPIPLAMVEGESEPLVNAAYVGQLAFANLWEGKIHLLPGAAHMPFWQNAHAFNILLLRFMRAMTQQAKGRRKEADGAASVRRKILSV